MDTKRKVLSLAGGLLLAITPALAVNGGQPDTAHPAVGFIFGSLTSDPCTGQVIGCTGVLIDPTVFLTSAGCADVFLHPEEYGYTLAAVWVNFDGADPTGCTGLSLVQSIAVNPAWDETSPAPIGNVGVMILSAAASPTPATLPTAGLLDTLPDSQPYTVVGFGDDNGGTSTSVVTTERRFAPAEFRTLDAEQIELIVKRAAQGLPRPCIGPLNEAGPAYLGSTNEMAALILGPDGGNCAMSHYQRLDVPSVRNFLSGYVTLP